jgi:hypothetical protein
MDFVLDSDPLYDKIAAPDQTNEQFQQLLAAANARGVVHTSPKGKGKQVQSGPSSGTNLGGMVSTPGKRKEAAQMNPLSETLASASSAHSLIDNAGFKVSALMVGIQCSDGRNSHTVVLVHTRSGSSARALELYDSLRSCQEVDEPFVNSDIDEMDRAEIQLATACLPVFMDDPINFGRSNMGLRHLGFVDDLSPNYMIKPAINSGEKEMFLDFFQHAKSLDMYILYIWTGVRLTNHDKRPPSNIYR